MKYFFYGTHTRENAPYELQVNMNDCFFEEECRSLAANTVQANTINSTRTRVVTSNNFQKSAYLCSEGECIARYDATLGSDE